MKILKPGPFFKRQRYIILFLSLSILFILVILLVNISLESLTDSLILSVLFCALGLFLIWSRYKDYTRKITFINKSALDDYLLSVNLILTETFTNWEHQIIIEGLFNNYLVRVDLNDRKGYLWKEYHFTIYASIKPELNDTIHWKNRVSELSKKGAYLFRDSAVLKNEIALNKYFIADKHLHEALVSLTTALKSSKINSV
jgi:hypothetical protein